MEAGIKIVWGKQTGSVWFLKQQGKGDILRDKTEITCRSVIGLKGENKKC